LKLILKLLTFLIINFTLLNAAQITDSFRFDAYGNINTIHGERNYDELRLSGGFQGRYKVNDNISITSQIHIKEGKNSKGKPSNSLEDYDTELKWLYLDYDFENDITFRIGAFQFPVFKASQTGDIEYTYTWTNAPLRSYGVFGAADFNGAEILKKFSYKDFDFLAQLSLGESSTQLGSNEGSIEGNIDSLVGLTLKTYHESFLLNIGYIQANANLYLHRLPFLNKSLQKINQSVDLNMIAIESEIYLDEFTLKSGLIKTNLSNIFTEDLNYYSSIEYNYKDITPYFLYSKEIAYLKRKEADIITEAGKAYKERFSLGLRYELSDNIALKFSYTHEDSKSKINNLRKFEGSDNIFMGTMNFVF